MRKIALIVLGLLALTALSSCSSTRYVPAQADYQTAWRGSTYSQIVQTFGAPDRTMSDGADGQILIYEKMTTTINCYPGFGYGPWYGPWHSSYSSTAYTDCDYIQFYVDKNLVCYNVRTNYVKPEGTEFDLGKTLLLTGTALILLSPLSVFPIFW